MGKAPIENSLGHIPTLGLKSSKLIDAIYDKARSEEEIMEFLQDAELLRLSTFCQQSSTVPEKRSRITLQHVDDALSIFFNFSRILSFSTSTFKFFQEY